MKGLSYKVKSEDGKYFVIKEFEGKEIEIVAGIRKVLTLEKAEAIAKALTYYVKNNEL